jgi:hypothetical protein
VGTTGEGSVGVDRSESVTFCRVLSTPGKSLMSQARSVQVPPLDVMVSFIDAVASAVLDDWVESPHG